MIALIQSLIPLEWLVAAAVAITGFFTIWFGGRRSAQADHKAEEAEEYADTRRQMDKVGRMSDADAAREWLRDRGERKRDL